MTTRRHALVGLLLLTLAAAGCTGGGDGADAPDQPAEQPGLNVAARAGYDRAATGEPERFIAGVSTAGNKSLVGGTVEMSFAFLGAEEASGTPRPGPTTEGRFLAVPQKAPEQMPPEPTAMPPAEAVGVYETEVAFDRAGYWQVTVTADLAGGETTSGTGAFHVTEDHLIPQVGDAAPDVDNLTMDDVGDVPDGAVDSRAGGDGASVPDPVLHRTTISEALEQQRPLVVVFSTPVYCRTQYCGPITDTVEELAGRYGDRAAFVHVEVWRDYEGRELNDAYDAWINEGDQGTEPWLFTVDADGTIAQRWDNVPDIDAVESWLQQLPGS